MSDLLSLKELIEFCQIEAINNRFNSTEASVWRSLCRDYSKKFHTPLQQVMTLDPEHILLNLYEDGMESVEVDDPDKIGQTLETLMRIEDPEYQSKRDKEEEDYLAAAEAEEAERIASGKGIPMPSKKTLLKKPKNEPKNKPPGGYINLDYLASLDEEQ